MMENLLAQSVYHGTLCWHKSADGILESALSHICTIVVTIMIPADYYSENVSLLEITLNNRFRTELFTQHFSNGDFTKTNRGFNFLGLEINYSF